MKIVVTGKGLKISSGGGEACLNRIAFLCGYRISDIAQKLECSPRHLQCLFIRSTGLTPKEWTRRERMVVARRMLAAGISQDTAALKLGFSNVSGFRREFQRFHGVLPKRFQKNSAAATEPDGLSVRKGL